MTTAFIGLDYIVDITHPSGKMAAAAEQVNERGVIDKANQLLELAREKGWLSVLVKVGFEQGYVDQPKHSQLFGKAHEIGVLEMGSAGMEFHPDLAADKADMVIIKPRVSAFYGTRLDAALRACGITRVVVAGVSTMMAVQSAAREAHDRDFEVIIAEQACAAATPEDHEASIRTLQPVTTVMTLDELKAL
ncbi:cysteine hydrolase family protein [Phytohalomonas tamaricis]|uniref:cysteine hydrolase family protein n=1 Tax=Phytohalomonas tamaricis TaxID=2081032 RepID=UPI000D0BC0E1|nr:isochorismatase family cysteine hydrolase [Phytohalomonas tamaricis]